MNKVRLLITASILLIGPNLVRAADDKQSSSPDGTKCICPIEAGPVGSIGEDGKIEIGNIKIVTDQCAKVETPRCAEKYCVGELTTADKKTSTFEAHCDDPAAPKPPIKEPGSYIVQCGKSAIVDNAELFIEKTSEPLPGKEVLADQGNAVCAALMKDLEPTKLSRWICDWRRCTSDSCEPSYQIIKVIPAVSITASLYSVGKDLWKVHCKKSVRANLGVTCSACVIAPTPTATYTGTPFWARSTPTPTPTPANGPPVSTAMPK